MTRYKLISTVAFLAVLAMSQVILLAEPSAAPPVYAQRGWSTVALGGILPSAKQLMAMRNRDYILRASAETLTKIPAKKIPLPLDPYGHVQCLALFTDANNTIYAAQRSILSKSKDGGKTWTHLRRATNQGQSPTHTFANIRILPNGDWITGHSTQQGEIAFSTSQDEGRSWQEISRIGKDLETNDLRLGSLEFLRDGTFIVPLTAVYWKDGNPESTSKSWEDVKILFYRSSDGAISFEKPSVIGQWGHEVNVSELPSGQLVATIRYQRNTLPSDPPNILVLTGAARHQHTIPYKHVFLSDSSDGGKTWSALRQVTTECGQCHGHSIGLSDGRVVMVFDHRYPRPMSGARAVVSDDEGQTWRDEAFFLSNGRACAGFARTISLDGKVMLTLTGYFDGDPADFHNATGGSQFHIIRWQLE